MKIIMPDLIESVTSGEADANYPLSQITDDFQMRVWRATSRDDTVVFTCTAKSDTIGFFNTNAQSVSVEITDMANVNIAGPTAVNMTVPAAYWSTKTGIARYYVNGWHEYTQQAAQHKVKITFDAGAGNTVYCGKVIIGPGHDFRNPVYNMKETLKDYSEVHELNSGATYIKSRPIVKKYSGQFLVDKTSEMQTMMRIIMQDLRSEPTAILVLEGEDENEAVYGRFESMPVASHSYHNYGNIDFAILEVL